MVMLRDTRESMMDEKGYTKKYMQMIADANIIITGLCRVVGESATKRIAKKALKALKKTDIKGAPKTYRKRILKSVYQGGKKAKKAVWDDLKRLILKDNKFRDYLKEEYNPEYVSQFLYHGVTDFYKNKKRTKKILVTSHTRNIADAYKKAIGIDEVKYEVFDKKKVINNIISQNPKKRRYLFIGNSKEDDLIVNHLNSLVEKGKIDSVVGLKVYTYGFGDAGNFFNLIIGKNEYNKITEEVNKIQKENEKKK